MYVVLYPERVKSLREERGMGKRDLAVAAGISKTTGRNAERGEPVRSKAARSVARGPAQAPRPPGAAAVGTRTGPGPSRPGAFWRSKEIRCLRDARLPPPGDTPLVGSERPPGGLDRRRSV